MNMTAYELPTELLPVFYEDDAAAQLSAYQHQVSIGFAEYQTALGFSRAGDLLILGESSLHTYARNLRTDNMALLRSTDKKTVYGIALGKIIVLGRSESYQLPSEPIYLTIGEPCEIPGVGITEPISQAMLSYRPHETVQHYVYDESTGNPVISPFIDLAAQIIALSSVPAET